MKLPLLRGHTSIAAATVLGLAWGSIVASVATAQTRAFPGAEGFGQYATGARTNLSAASVYHVTNLNASGAGSFRDAVSQPNRFVVFDVGGIVTLAPTDSAIVVASNVTIAGQTAPGNFVVYGNRVTYSGANNSITRYLGVHKGQAGYREDAVSLANGSNMMFDHMSVTWGVDETFSLNWDGKGNSIDRITIQDSVIAQGQDRLGHSAGGLMTLPEGGRFSVIRSVFADNVTRNPKVRGDQEFINNVIYGWETAAYIMGDTTSMNSHANVIGNYFIEGPINGGSPFTGGTANFSIYGADNWVDPDRDGVLDGAPVTSYPGATVMASPFAYPTTSALPAAAAVDYVMEHAGLSIVRDVVDARIMQEVASYGTLGGVIQRETDLFPNYGSDPKYLQPRGRLTDSDNDGIADNWELAHGLSPTNPSDWKGLSAAGYTQLEEYVNELGAAGTTVLSGGGAWGTAGTWSGGSPTLADDAFVIGTVSVAGGTHGFARRLDLAGSLQVSDGTVDVFDTASITRGTLLVSGGTATFGQLLLGSAGQAASLALLSGGTLQSGPIGVAGGTVSFAWNGGTLRPTVAGSITVPATLGAADCTLDVGSQAVTYSGRLSGTGGLVKTGSGSLTLSAANTFSGGTVLDGVLRLTNSSAAGSGPIRISSAGGAVHLGNGVTIANDITTDYSFEVLDVPDANATATLAGSLGGIGSRQVRLRTTGAGATLNVTGSITAGYGFYLTEGNVVVSGTGTVAGGRGAAVGRNNSVSLTLRDNSSFNVGGFSMGGTKAMPTGVITVRDNATLSTDAASLDLLSTSSTTSFSELNLDGGTTTVGGFLKTSVGAAQTSEIDFNGGLLRYGGTAANAAFLPVLAGLTANVQAGGARIDDAGQAIAIALPLIHDPALSGVDGGLVKSGTGTLTLTGTNTYTGGTVVAAGTLALAVGGTTGTIRGPLAVSSGATVLLAATNALGLAAGSSVSQVSVIGGVVDIAVSGPNGHLASWTLTGGTMSSSGGGAFQIDAAGGGSIASRASGITSVISGPVAIRGIGAVLPIDVADGPAATDLRITGVLSNNGVEGGVNGIRKTGGGTLSLAADNTYTGPTTVAAGVLTVDHPSALASSMVTVEAGATLRTGPGVTLRTPSVTVSGGTLDTSALTVDALAGIVSLTINGGSLASSPSLAIGLLGEVTLARDVRTSVAVGALAVDQGSTGRLDLGAGQISIAPGGISPADLRADLLVGRNGGGWNSISGITSSAAAASGGTRTVGYRFSGDGTATVSYAAAGDVDLSGEVDVFDLVAVNGGGAYGNGAASTWQSGDFNYDSVTNVFDLVAVNTGGSYGRGNYFPAASSATVAPAAVPEPTAGLAASTALAVVGWSMARGSRRRRRPEDVAVC
jgi:autotransporter-associated beta strand protein